MHMRSWQTRWTPARVAVLAALLLAAAALLWPAPAWAHTRLQSSEPAADETVTEPFDTVLLVFSQAVSRDFAEVAVIDPSGNRIDDEAPIMDGARVEQPVTELQEVGEYTVEWRVVANDGHPLEGTFEFTYDGELPEAAEPEDDAATAAPDVPATEPDTPDETPSTEDDAVVEEEPEVAAPAAGGGSGSGTAPLPLAIAAIVIALAVGAATYAVRAIRSWEPIPGPGAG